MLHLPDTAENHIPCLVTSMGFGKSHRENSQADKFDYDLTSMPESTYNRIITVLLEVLGNKSRALHMLAIVLSMSYNFTYNY